MNNKLILFLLGFTLIFSCQPKSEKQIELAEISFPGNEDSSLPYLYASENGLFLSWTEMLNDSKAGLFYSQLNNGVWKEAQLITESSDWFVNWADFPSIVEHKGNILTHILPKSSPSTFSYDVKLNILAQGENEWKTELPLHTDSTLTEHGFVSTIPYSDDSFLLSWLDGRNTGGSSHDHAEHSGAMSVRAAEVDFQGKVIWDELLDAKTCDCCQTTTAMTSEGPVVLYRNRSDREIRDIAITRLMDGKWTEPKIIHADGWEIAGCPVNGPKVDAHQETVVAAWFTAAQANPQVKLAFSTNSGADFMEPLVLSEGNAIGRVDVALMKNNSALVTWMEMEEDTAYLFVQKVSLDGKRAQKQKVTAIDPGRKSGFPQMEIFDEQVYFAWTHWEDNQANVRLSSLHINGFDY